MRPPIYNVAFRLITTWIYRKGPPASYDKLMTTLQKQDLQVAYDSVKKWWIDEHPSMTDGPNGKVEKASAHDIAMNISRDDGLQRNFMKFLNAFELTEEQVSGICEEFTGGRRLSEPIYNLIIQCLRSWYSTTISSARTWEALLLALKDIPSAEKEVIKCFNENNDSIMKGLSYSPLSMVNS